MKSLSTGIYVRVSTEEQAQEGFSIRGQTEKLKSYALLKEWDTQNANNWNADLFLSIHVNSFSQPRANGTEVFIFDNNSTRAKESRRLATYLLDSFVARIGTNNRGVRLDGQSQHAGGLGVLRNTRMPAALLELAFISAAAEFADVHVLRNRRVDMAEALAQGILNYLGVLQTNVKG